MTVTVTRVLEYKYETFAQFTQDRNGWTDKGEFGKKQMRTIMIQSVDGDNGIVRIHPPLNSEATANLVEGLVNESIVSSATSWGQRVEKLEEELAALKEHCSVWFNAANHDWARLAKSVDRIISHLRFTPGRETE